MHLLDPLGNNQQDLSSIYEKIFYKNAIAFLGAGASVSNYQYLSKELIELYQTKISKDFGTNNVTKFVDILQSTNNQWRGDFDTFVVERLNKLIPNEGHKILVTIPWKQIITTNYDTLVEEASDAAIRDGKTHFKIKAIRSKGQFDYQPGNNEITYVKLNGCKTDLAQYPLVFSTQDFANQSSFYKKVLSPFKGFSNEIIYLAFGYSFTDEFSESLLEKLISNDFRQKRKVYCVDPFVNPDSLDYFESRGISIIKQSFIDFFAGYKRWYEVTHKDYLRNLQKFSNPDKTLIKIETGARLYLDSNLLQLKDEYKGYDKVKKLDFYSGSEPNYQVILDGFDVVKTEETQKLDNLIRGSFNGQSRTAIPKLLLVSGDFGSGKTTFTLRAIREYIQNEDSTLAFEITRGVGIKKGYLAQLIKESTANQFIFYCDNMETDSIFKRFNEIRIELASEQYSDKSIVFISSIRENILEKLKNQSKISIQNFIEFNYKSTYNADELSELVDNLKEVGLIQFRDREEKRSIVYKLKTQYKGDSFLSLYTLIENGSHYKLLKKAYDELTPEIQTAFKLTALVHRFNMECPASIIKNAIKTMDWTQFTDKVVRGDGKNILFQESRTSTNSDPDLFFKTKHPVIAEALIKNIFRNSEKNYLYKNIFSGLPASEYNSRFIVDLIKNLRSSDNDITEGQIENYYELCKKEFEKSVHFMLSYITHIEKRTDKIKVLEQCILDIEMIESTLDYRNNRLIHRKGSLNFKIAKLLFSSKSELESEIKEYLNIAEDWFLIKKELDPSSKYSYLDYFNLLLWELRNIRLENSELLQLHLHINILFEEAFRLIEDDKNVVTDIFEEYKHLKATVGVQEGYYEYLLEQYQVPENRPIACILLYYYHDENRDYRQCSEFVDELTNYKDIKDVVYFLFKYYGRNLYNSNNRIRYFELIRYNSFLKEEHPMRYYYFGSVCDAYDRRWKDSIQQLADIKSYRNTPLNPDFFLYWCDENGNEQVFDGEIVLDKNIKKVRINSLYKEFVFVKGNYNGYSKNQFINVKLRFSFEGIRAEIAD